MMITEVLVHEPRGDAAAIPKAFPEESVRSVKRCCDAGPLTQREIPSPRGISVFGDSAHRFHACPR
jgi:hypothetical protein